MPSTEPPNCRTALRGRNATYIGPGSALVDPLRQLLRLRGRELRVGVGVDVDRVALPRLHGGVDRAVLGPRGRRGRQRRGPRRAGRSGARLAAGGVRPAHGPQRQHVGAGLRRLAAADARRARASSSAIRLESAFSASAIGSGRWTQSASGPSGLRPSTRTGWPGLPTTVEFGGTSWTTTALAPIFAPWPIRIGPSSFAPEPIVTLSSTVGWRLPVAKPVPPSVTPW